MKVLVLICAIATFSMTSLAKDPFESEQKKCDAIQCTDLDGIKSMNCKKAKGQCFKDIFHKRIELWKVKGITFDEKAKVLKALSASEKKNETLIENLEVELVELKKMLNELKRLQKEVKSLKGPSK